MLKFLVIILLFFSCSSPNYQSAGKVFLDYIQEARVKEDLKTAYEKIGRPVILIDSSIYAVNLSCLPDKLLKSFRYYTFIIEPPRQIYEMQVSRVVSGDTEKSKIKKKSLLDEKYSQETNQELKSLYRAIMYYPYKSNLYDFPIMG